MKTCISWTKVGTNVIFPDNEKVLLFQIYDFQLTWCDLYFRSKQELQFQHILTQNV